MTATARAERRRCARWIFLIQSLRAKVIDYPGNMDPDDFVKENGLSGIRCAAKAGATEYRMLRAKDDLDMTTQEGITQYAMRCCEILKRLKSPIEAENYLRKLVNETGYDRETLLAQIGRFTFPPGRSRVREHLFTFAKAARCSPSAN